MCRWGGGEEERGRVAGMKAEEKFLCSVLEQHFSNGIRPNSVIDIGKLTNVYRKHKKVKLIKGNTDIVSLLGAVGICSGDKIFFIRKEDKMALVNLVKQLILSGQRIFFYNEIYERHSDFMMRKNIHSKKLLKTLLVGLLPSLYHSKNYFAKSKNVTMESEILHCYKTTICLSFAQIKEKLPYLPLEKIKQMLTLHNDFIWVTTSVYTHISKIEIDYNEVKKINNKIKTEIAKHGYFSLASFDLPRSCELNPELSRVAVRNGLFKICFADRYEKRGNIVTQKGTILNSITLLKDYCLTHDRLTIDELFDFEKEIYDGVHSQSLFIAYDTMIRIDKNIFVSDEMINFDVEKIDNALALFVTDDIVPLRIVTSFISFPYIEGYHWNLFLLESFCRRFSKVFTYQCLSVNSRNVVAIYKKTLKFANYIDVLADVVFKKGITLTKEDVGNFLFENGYIAQRTDVILKIIEKAKQVAWKVRS
jgi:hypothetical protein